MSKSLKNFVSIQDYLKKYTGTRWPFVRLSESIPRPSIQCRSTACLTMLGCALLSSSGRQFRIFCLLHGYGKPVDYSDEHMQHAVRASYLISPVAV
jgi:cysteinyl-tRNA synthetase